MAVALGAAAGPIVGGAILAFAPWQWLFALNVPIGIAAYRAGAESHSENARTQRPFDAPSALMSVRDVRLGRVRFRRDRTRRRNAARHRPKSSPPRSSAGSSSGASSRLPLPMFAVDLFEQLRFTLAVFACYASFVAQTIAYVALPFAFQTVMGHTPLQVGALLLPWLLASAVMAPISGPLADRYNSSRLAAIGLGIFSVGLLCATLMGSDPAPLDIAWRMALCGIGYGLFQSPNNRAMQNSAPRERSGAPQAIQGVARVFGQTTGALIVAIVFALEA